MTKGILVISFILNPNGMGKVEGNQSLIHQSEKA